MKKFQIDTSLFNVNCEFLCLNSTLRQRFIERHLDWASTEALINILKNRNVNKERSKYIYTLET